jgi:hypothetical protein
MVDRDRVEGRPRAACPSRRGVVGAVVAALAGLGVRSGANATTDGCLRKRCKHTSACCDGDIRCDRIPKKHRKPRDRPGDKWCCSVGHSVDCFFDGDCFRGFHCDHQTQPGSCVPN